MLKRLNRAILFKTSISLLFGFFIIFASKSNALVVLQYHHISDSTPKSTSLSPHLFEQHLRYLKENRFTVLDLKTVLHGLKNKLEFPNKSVLITFDDGYRSIFDTAYPLLKQYQFPFTVFISTQPLEKELQQFMSWQELQFLIDNGGSIANHSVTHPHLIKKNSRVSSKKQIARLKQELLTAHKTLESKLSKVHRAFAYPYGEYDHTVKQVLKKLDFIGFAQHSGAVSYYSDLQAIPRFPFGGNYGSIDDFEIKVNSLPLKLQSFIFLDQSGKKLKSHLIPRRISKLLLQLVLDKQFDAKQVTCYSPLGVALESRLIGLHTKQYILESIPEGRSRVNCTAPAGDKRFLWSSIPIIKANSLGNYY